jgi:hypothetical protein
VEENNNWVQYDPYLEAVMGFNGYMQVTPQHYAWGILTSQDLFLAGSLNNITNTDNMIVDYDQPQLVLGDSFNVSAELQVVNDLERTVGVQISNKGSNIVYLQELQLLAATLPVTGTEQVGILPGQSKYIDLSPYISWQMLLSHQGQLQGWLELSSNGKLNSLNTNNVHINSYWLLPVEFAALFLFFALLVKLGRLAWPRLNTVIFPGLFRNKWWSELKLRWQSLTFLNANTVLAPPLEPADPPDIPSGSLLEPQYELTGNTHGNTGYYRHYKEV